MEVRIEDSDETYGGAVLKRSSSERASPADKNGWRIAADESRGTASWRAAVDLVDADVRAHIKLAPGLNKDGAFLSFRFRRSQRGDVVLI